MAEFQEFQSLAEWAGGPVEAEWVGPWVFEIPLQ